MAGSASLLWVAAGLIGLMTVAPEIDRVVAAADAEQVSGGFAIPRAPDGQFYVDGKAGETPVRFLIDSGTDAVLLSGWDAQRLGIAPEAGSVTLASLAIGPLEVREVTVQVAPDLPVSLLGRAFLSRHAAAEVLRDRMILR